MTVPRGRGSKREPVLNIKPTLDPRPQPVPLAGEGERAGFLDPAGLVDWIQRGLGRRRE